MTKGWSGAPTGRTFAMGAGMVLLAVGLGVGAGWVAFRLETARVSLDRSQAGAAAAALTEEVLQENAGVVAAAAAFTSEVLQPNGPLKAKEHRFFEVVAAANPQPRYMAWHPLVSRAERRDWETENAITIVERGPDGGLRTAAARGFHLPLLTSYVETRMGRPKGFDALSDSQGRNALDTTRRRGLVALGRTGAPGSGHDMMLVQAVFRGPDVPNTAQLRRRRFAGVVTMTFSGDVVLSRVLKEMGDAASGITLLDGKSAMGTAGAPPGGQAVSRALRGAGTGLSVVVDGPYHRRSGVLIGAGFGGLLVGALGIGAVLAWRRRLRDAQRNAGFDSLTGLINRRTFEQKLDTEIARARRHGRSLSLALIDVDHFKRVNDTYGHPGGDRLLAEIGRLLAEATRAGEAVARLGGDEFGFILPETEPEEAFLALERLRVEVAHLHIGEGHATLSVGIAQCRHAESSEALVERADAALYRAKAAGRDCVMLFSDDPVDEVSGSDTADRARRAQAFAALRVLASARDGRGESPAGLGDRVATLCAQLATVLGWTPERTAMIYEAALIYNVGHISVPEFSAAAETWQAEDDFDVESRYVEASAEMAARALSDEQVSWIRHHRERYDGSGFPAGLAGHEIPDGARMIGLADAWERMCSDRASDGGLTPESALRAVLRDTESRHCPTMVEALGALVAAGALFAFPLALAGGPHS